MTQLGPSTRNPTTQSLSSPVDLKYFVFHDSDTSVHGKGEEFEV